MKKIIWVIIVCQLCYACTTPKHDKDIHEDRRVGCSSDPMVPPLAPPPEPFAELQQQAMQTNYFGKTINFQLRLFSERRVRFNRGYLQNYLVEAINYRETDSFYFALSDSLECYWGALQLKQGKTGFDIGYVEEKSFRVLYTVHLGDSLNIGRIYMNTPEAIRYSDSFLHAARTTTE